VVSLLGFFTPEVVEGPLPGTAAKEVRGIRYEREIMGTIASRFKGLKSLWK
jgi:hypothetical protein